jgi:hypothetical protein
VPLGSTVPGERHTGQTPLWRWPFGQGQLYDWSQQIAWLPRVTKRECTNGLPRESEATARAPQVGPSAAIDGANFRVQTPVYCARIGGKVRIMRLRLTLPIALAAGVCLLPAQTSGTQASQVDSEFIASTVASLQSLIKQHYFDTEAIPNIDSALIAANASETIGQAKDLEQLATILTTTLYQASHDKHLFVSAVPKMDASAEQGQLSRADSARLSNYGMKAAEVLDGNVGYLKITSFYRRDEGAADALNDAMRFLSHTDALILDLRGNQGGAPDTVVQLLSYFFGQPDLPLFQVIPRAGEVVTYRTTAIGATLRDEARPLYVLVSTETWSAGEGVPFILQERNRATIVGERTAGAANPASPWPLNRTLTVTIPFGRIKSAVLERNWEGTGVIPDVAASSQEAFKVAYVKALEILIQRTKSIPAQQVLTKAVDKAKSSGHPDRR